MTAKPVRLQLGRRKGFDLQAWSREVNGLPAVRVSRPGRFGNPFTVADARETGWRGDDRALAARCVGAFRVWADSPHWRENWQGPESEQARAALLAELPALRGKNLACWCGVISRGTYSPCHADVLLSLANGIPLEEVINENIRRAEGQEVQRG